MHYIFLLQECRYRIALPENYTIKFSCDDFGLQVGCSGVLVPNAHGCATDLGTSNDLKSADKELKAVTPEKSKSYFTTFNKKLVTTFQLSRTRSGHISLK